MRRWLVKAVLAKSGDTLIESVETASSLAARMRGLLGRDGLARGHALHIVHCDSIHTFFMKFSLDLVFLDRGNRVVKVVSSVTPWRMVWGGPGACSVLEMSAGWFNAASVRAVCKFAGRD